MGRFFICVMMLAAMGLSTPAFAQAEFDAFTNALEKNKGDSKKAPADDPMQDEFDPAALGPAGDLPFGNNDAAMGGFGVGTPQTPEELQALMEKEQEDMKRKFEEQTFQQALKQLLPLSPDQIRKTLETFRISREAAETPITEPEPRQEV